MAHRCTTASVVAQVVQRAEDAVWVRHTNGLWLPRRFLVPDVAAAAAAAVSPPCEDESQHCPEWAAAGDCERNLQYHLLVMIVSIGTLD
eukprot:COSAG01_NODE_920_length_12728_cov_38.396864_18_plen_89_part_00